MMMNTCLSMRYKLSRAWAETAGDSSVPISAVQSSSHRVSVPELEKLL
jgi:hypothetical protein